MSYNGRTPETKLADTLNIYIVQNVKEDDHTERSTNLKNNSKKMKCHLEVEMLFFKMKKQDVNTLGMIFDTPRDAKQAYRFIMKFFSNRVTGVSLVRSPEYMILLDKDKGGWAFWRTELRYLISEEFLRSTDKYCIDTDEVTRMLYPSIIHCKSNLPMVVEK